MQRASQQGDGPGRLFVAPLPFPFPKKRDLRVFPTLFLEREGGELAPANAFPALRRLRVGSKLALDPPFFFSSERGCFALLPRCFWDNPRVSFFPLSHPRCERSQPSCACGQPLGAVRLLWRRRRQSRRR